MKKYYYFIILLLFQFQINAQCVEPSNVYIETSIYEGYFPHITWTENGTATTWDIEYDYTGFYPTSIPTEEDLNDTRFNIDGLENVSYDFYVRSDCGSEQSDWVGPYTFYNYCIGDSYTNFENTFLPFCWSQANNGTPDNEPLGFGQGSWEQSNFANGSSNLSAKINIYGTAINDWLITPLIEKIYPLRDEWFGIDMDFTIALTQHNSTDPAVLGSDDQIQLVYSHDFGKTWHNLQTWNSSSSISNTGETIYVFEDGYNNSAWLLVAFWVSSGTINDAENIDFFIDYIGIGHYGEGSIDDLQSKDFAYFPNPIQNILTVSAKESINTVIIYDLMGKKIVNKKIAANQDQIDLKDIEKGLYFMRVRIGNTEGVVKIVKE